MIIYPQDKILIHLCMRKTNANLLYKIRYNLNLRKQYIRKNLREIQWEQCLCHIGTQIYDPLFLLPLWHLLFTSIHFTSQLSSNLEHLGKTGSPNRLPVSLYKPPSVFMGMSPLMAVLSSLTQSLLSPGLHIPRSSMATSSFMVKQS